MKKILSIVCFSFIALSVPAQAGPVQALTGLAGEAAGVVDDRQLTAAAWNIKGRAVANVMKGPNAIKNADMAVILINSCGALPKGVKQTDLAVTVYFWQLQKGQYVSLGTRATKVRYGDFDSPSKCSEFIRAINKMNQDTHRTVANPK